MPCGCFGLVPTVLQHESQIVCGVQLFGLDGEHGKVQLLRFLLFPKIHQN